MRPSSIESETVCGRDAAVEPPRMGLRRVEETMLPGRIYGELVKFKPDYRHNSGLVAYSGL